MSKLIGNQIIEINTVDSTNNYAAKLLNQTKIPFGTVIMALFQSEGKGQRNASWQSSSGENLLVSTLLNVKDLGSDNIYYLSKAVALAVRFCIVDFLNKDAKIKWPNDVLVDGEKIAGVLIENKWKNQNLHSSVVGVGINVNQFDFPLPFSATSLALCLNKKLEVSEVLESWCKWMNLYFGYLLDREFVLIDRTYHQHLINMDNWAQFVVDDHSFTAKTIGVNPQGQLILKLKDGQEKLFNLKEIRQIV